MRNMREAEQDGIRALYGLVSVPNQDLLLPPHELLSWWRYSTDMQLFCTFSTPVMVCSCLASQFGLSIQFQPILARYYFHLTNENMTVCTLQAHLGKISDSICRKTHDIELGYTKAKYLITTSTQMAYHQTQIVG